MTEGRRALHPLVELTLVRFREFLREPDAVFWSFFFPVLLSAGLGVAFRNRPPIPIQVAATSPALVSAIRQEPLLAVDLAGEAAARELLRVGKVALVAAPDEHGGVVYRYDPLSPDSRTAAMLADRAIQRAAGRADPVASRQVTVAEPGSRYIDYLMPGLLGLTIMSGGIWGVVYPIVDARRRKLLKRFLTTPMPRHYYLLSFLISGLARLTVEGAIILGFGVFVFGIPLRGSGFDLIAICILSALAFGSLGLLAASRVRTLEAANGLMNLCMLPMWILSGVFFSAQRFPDALQPAIRALPLTACIDALRANMLQGAGLVQVQAQMAVLAAWIVVCFPLALRIFRWR